MKSLVPILAMALALAGCRNPPSAEAPAVENVWVRLPAVPGRPGAAYFIVRGGRSETRLVSISSPQVERIEMHGPGMRPLGPQAVPAGGELVFAPAANHAMLHGIRNGESFRRIPLQFHFDSGTVATARAIALPAGLNEPIFVAARPAGPGCREGVRREGETLIATNCGR